MRVATIIQAYHPRIGGAEKLVGAVSPALQTCGDEVHVLTRRYAGLKSFEIVNGIAVHRLPILGPKVTASLGFTLAALPLLRRLRPALIHAHELLSPTTTAITAKRLFGAPVVVTVHSCGAQGEIARLKNKFMGARRLATFRQQVDAFVVINHDIDAELDEIGVPQERRTFIPNGVDTTHFAPPADKAAVRAALGLPNAPLAVYTGRFAPEKRLDLLLEAWSMVRERIPNALLLLVGQGKAEADLRERAGAGAQFVGATDNVAPYLQAADVFVMSSAYEGLSVALLEAMATGLPTVVTAVGGNRDIITHGENGWLVPPLDVNALHSGLVSLLEDSTRRAELGRQARAHIVREYELSVTVRRLRELYERVVNSKRGNKYARPSDERMGLS
jgi:glycosyltransferase involved in cell wall biosynthesis